MGIKKDTKLFSISSILNEPVNVKVRSTMLSKSSLEDIKPQYIFGDIDISSTLQDHPEVMDNVLELQKIFDCIAYELNRCNSEYGIVFKVSVQVIPIPLEEDAKSFGIVVHCKHQIENEQAINLLGKQLNDILSLLSGDSYLYGSISENLIANPIVGLDVNFSLIRPNLTRQHLSNISIVDSNSSKLDKYTKNRETYGKTISILNTYLLFEITINIVTEIAN